ncbi:MAG: hypothetical protein ABJM26_07185 [Anderseniella sp.]
MLKRVILPLFLLVFVASSMSNTALAKKKKRFIFFSVKNEALVKVVDLPDVPQLKRTDGKYLDLGYKFTTVGGSWVGHIGSNKNYVKLNEQALQAMLTVARLKKLPPIPNRPLDNLLITLIVLGCIAAFAVQLLVLVAAPVASWLGSLRERGAASDLFKEFDTQPDQDDDHPLSQPTATPANHAAFGVARSVSGTARSSFGQRR